MARIRTIKPEIALHEELFDAEKETGFPIRFVWAVLPTICDRAGRFVWKPRKLKAQVLPHDDIDFSRVLDALATRGFIVKYASGTREYGAIPTFKKHQVINGRERASDLPDPQHQNCQVLVDTDKVYACVTRASRVDDTCVTREVHAQEGREGNKEGNKEGKGKEGKGETTQQPIETHIPARVTNGAGSSDDPWEKLQTDVMRISLLNKSTNPVGVLEPTIWRELGATPEICLAVVTEQSQQMIARGNPPRSLAVFTDRIKSAMERKDRPVTTGNGNGNGYANSFSHVPQNNTPRPSTTEAQERERMDKWVETGQWNSHFGENPNLGKYFDAFGLFEEYIAAHPEKFQRVLAGRIAEEYFKETDELIEQEELSRRIDAIIAAVTA